MRTTAEVQSVSEIEAEAEAKSDFQDLKSCMYTCNAHQFVIDFPTWSRKPMIYILGRLANGLAFNWLCSGLQLATDASPVLVQFYCCK